MELILPADIEHYYGKFYKFLSVKSALKTLQSGKLKFSNPTIFNDPLDCSKFLFDFDIHEKSLVVPPLKSDEKPPIDNFINEKYGQTLIDLIDIVYDLRKIKNDEIEGMKISSLKRLYQEIFSKEEIEKYRVCCFSQNYFSNKSFLMWSHYADSHRGICLEFDNRKYSRSKYSNLFVPACIKYQSKFPIIRSKLDFESNEWLWTKLKRFSYEKEVRIIIRNGTAENSSYLNFPKMFLTKIIFGINTTKEDIKKVNQVLDRRFNLKSLSFEKMRIEPHSLRLVKQSFDIKNQFLYR